MVQKTPVEACNPFVMRREKEVFAESVKVPMKKQKELRGGLFRPNSGIVNHSACPPRNGGGNQPDLAVVRTRFGDLNLISGEGEGVR